MKYPIRTLFDHYYDLWSQQSNGDTLFDDGNSALQ
jgi:hypothetical protein